MGKIINGLKMIAAGIVGHNSSGIAKKWTEFQFWLNGRDWDIPLGPVFGKAGTTTVITVAPQCYFRGEKLMASDTGGELPRLDEVQVTVAKPRRGGKKGSRRKIATPTPVEIFGDGTKSGTGTRITQVLIGQRLQFPATGGGTLTLFFANNSLGNGLRWDLCHPAYHIAMTVSFIQSCTFDAVIFGRALL